LIFQRFYCDDIYLFEECRGQNYGYGCNESCQCVQGTCNPNATNTNQSCTCNTGYQPPFCIQLIDSCGKNIYFVDELLDYEGNVLFCFLKQVIVHVIMLRKIVLQIQIMVLLFVVVNLAMNETTLLTIVQV